MAGSDCCQGAASHESELLSSTVTATDRREGAGRCRNPFTHRTFTPKSIRIWKPPRFIAAFSRPAARPSTTPACAAARFPMASNLFGTMDRVRYIFRDTLEAVRRLVELGILSEGDPSVSPRYFYSRAIFDIAYGDT